MRGSPRTIALALLAAAFAVGCCSPGSAPRPPDGRILDPVAQGETGPQALGEASLAGADADALRQVMAELHDLGALDPESQAQLVEDLSQTDPQWWPLVVQQFRAAAAYRERARPDLAAEDPAQCLPVQAASGNSSPEGPPDGQQVHTAAWQEPLPAASEPGGGDAQRPARLPATDDTALVPSSAPAHDYPTTPHLDSGPHLAGRPTELASLQVDYSPVQGATESDWQAQLSVAIQTLESRLRSHPAAADQLAPQAQLRMLYLLAGRRDDALEPIPSIPPAQQEFWSKELYGLAAWLDTERTADTASRAAEAKQVLEEAVSRLGESAPLVVRNLAFCTEVRSYGCLDRFEQYEFAPGAEVLLYAEVDNFTSQPTAKGHHTSLRSSYQIFDSRGQRVADHQFAATEEYCQNPRRDFFIGYHLHLPNRIYPGRHTLQLTIEDLKSHKLGQSSIELTIKDDEE